MIIYSLLFHISAVSSNFVWNDSVCHVKFSEDVDLAYNEIVHWKQNLFMVPSGKIGRAFTDELTRLLMAYGEGNNLQKVALMSSSCACHIHVQAGGIVGLVTYTKCSEANQIEE